MERKTYVCECFWGVLHDTDGSPNSYIALALLAAPYACSAADHRPQQAKGAFEEELEDAYHV